MPILFVGVRDVGPDANRSGLSEEGRPDKLADAGDMADFGGDEKRVKDLTKRI